MKNIAKLSLLLFFMWSCTQENSQESTTQESENVKESTTDFVGESFSTEGLTSLESLTAEMKANDSVMAVVQAEVLQVCQAKGCWMIIQLPSGEDMRVTFKDYGFFVPKDLAGQSVVMKGLAKIEETDVETLRHFAEDAGQSKEELQLITAPKKDYKFVATGVKILKKES